MGHIAKPGREDDIDDREMQAPRVGQHCKRTLKPALHKSLGERLSRLLEQLLDVSPRQAQLADDVVEIEIGLPEPSRNLCNHRPEPGRLHASLRDDFCGFGGRPEHRGDEIEKVFADGRGQFRRWLVAGRERSQVVVEQAKSRSRADRVACQVLRMGYKGFKGGRPYRNISVAEATWTKSTVRPCVM